MSTGQQHHNEKNALSFESINAHVRGLDLAALTAPTLVQATPAGQEKPASQEIRTQRLVVSYAAARPILVALAAIPFIPASWRAVLAVFTTTLDQVSASFRFGSSDAPVPGATASVEMEPKLPVG